MENQSEAFWCFVALMERLGPNFDRDQNGIHSQLLALSKLVEILDSPLHNLSRLIASTISIASDGFLYSLKENLSMIR